MARSQEILRDVAVKQDNGTMSAKTHIGVYSEQVIDSVSGYTVAQFCKAFNDFISTANFYHYGKNPPSNNRHKIWIDTGTPQNVFVKE